MFHRLAQNGQDQDWEELIFRHGRYLRRLCKRYVEQELWLDDAVQEVLLCLRRDLPSYRSHSDGEASAWLRAVVRHCT